MTNKVIVIHVNPRRLDTVPGLTVYEIKVEDDKAEWLETFGALDDVRAFIRGVKAGASFMKNFNVEVDVINDKKLEVE